MLGRIPADRLYSTGIALLSRYPMPNVTQAAGTNYNYEAPAPTTENLTQQPALRVDYQLSPNLRFTGKYSGQRARKLITPGTIAGFNDVQNPYPFITNYGVTVNYTMNSSTFIEGTYGFIRNQLAGGASIGATGPAASSSPSRRTGWRACRTSRCSTRTRVWSTSATTLTRCCRT